MSLINRLFGNPSPDSGDSASTTPATEAVPTVDPQLESLARWQRVVEVAPDNLDARLHVVAGLQKTRDGDALEAAIADTAARFPDERRVMFLVARHLFGKNANDEAFERWTEIERRWPDDVEAAGNVGFLLVRLDRAEEALDKARELEARDPDRAERLRIKAFSHLERHAEAIEVFERIRERRPLDEQESVNLATLHLACEDIDEAAVLAIAALEQTPDSAPLVRLMVRVFERQQEPEQALELLERSAADRVGAAYKTTKSIGLMIALGRFDDADRTCVEALEHHPDDADLLLLHARCAQARFGSLRAA